ncbi:MAG: hypothetical protein KF901_08390 [Myxococcales bacterium]|nr:hypothetical protein [Myxococcales bacterium]
MVRCLLAARWWLLGAFIVGAAIGLPTAKFAIKRSYTATAMLRFGGLPTIEGLGAPSDATQTLGGLLQGIFVEGSLREIGSRTGLEVPTYVLGTWIQAEADPAQVVRISATATEADEAARFANTVVQVFLERQTEAQRERIREAIGSIEERLTAAQAAVTAARTSYDTFRNRHGIADLTTEQETAIEQAAELRATRDRTASEIDALEARVEQLRRDLRSTPRTALASASVGASAEETERGRLQAELASARSSLSDDHPRVQALRQQIAALDERIRSGQAEKTRSATATASTQYMSLQAALSQSQADLEAARQRLEGLTRLAREAQQRVEQFSSIEGDASQLLAEVRVNEQLMQELQGRKARLEDALRNPDHGFQPMSEATPPELPEASKKKYIVAAAFPLGFLFIVLGVVLARELRGLKIRTAKEAAFWGRGPVVGTSTWPRVPDAIDDLVADLDDFVPTAAGKMLVVGLGEGAPELAMRFASRLSNDWVDTTVVGGSPFDEPDLRAPSLPPDAGGYGHHHAIALAGRTHHVDQLVAPELQVEAWEGADSGPALRRAARLADRVCVIVPANVTSALELKDVKTRLGRTRGVGYVLIDVADEYAEQDDRVGPVEAFWACVRE